MNHLRHLSPTIGATLMACVVSCSVSATKAPVIKNAGFELRDDGQAVPGWAVSYWSQTPQQDISVSEERASHGNSSLKIKLEDPNPRGGYGLSLHQRISPPDTNSVLKLSFDCWSNSKLRLKLAISSAPDNQIPYEYGYAWTAGDSKWSPIEIQLPAYKFDRDNILWNGRDAWLELCVYTTYPSDPGTLYIDNVQLVETNTTTQDVEIDPETIHQYSVLVSRAKEQLAARKSESRRDRLQQVSTVLDGLGHLSRRRDMVPLMSRNQAVEIDNTLNWAEQLLGIDEASVGAGVFDEIETWVLDAVSTTYPANDALVIEGALGDSLRIVCAQGETTAASFLV